MCLHHYIVVLQISLKQNHVVPSQLFFFLKYKFPFSNHVRAPQLGEKKRILYFPVWPIVNATATSSVAKDWFSLATES